MESMLRPVEDPDDEETKFDSLRKTDAELAWLARLQDAFREFKFSKKQIHFIADMILQKSGALIKDAMASFGKRLGDLEERLNALEHSTELKNQKQDSRVESLGRKLDSRIMAVIWIACVMAFFVTTGLAIGNFFK